MASVTLKGFTPGETVSAYPKANWLFHELPATGAPKGSAAASAPADASGTVTLGSLAPGTAYYVRGGTSLTYRSLVTHRSTDALEIPGVHMPPDGLPFWKAARERARAGAGLARVAVVGDSVTVGYYASDIEAKSWSNLVRTSLQALYGDGGSGVKSVIDSTVVLTNDGRAAAIQNAWAAIPGNLVTLAGTWDEVVNGTDGPGASILRAKSIGAQLSAIGRGTTAEIYYQTTPNAAAAGTFTWSVDGGAESAPVSQFHATQGTVEKVTIPGLSPGQHTVRITCTDTDGTTKTASFCAVSFRNATGVVLDRYARGGQPSAAACNRLPGTFTWNNASGAAWGGSAQNLRGGAGSWMGGSSRPADLVIYALGLNDGGSVNVTPDNFVFNVRDYLEDVKSGGTQQGDTDVLILMMHPGKIETATTRYYTQYVDRLRGIAEGYGAAFVNMWALGRNSWNYWNTLGYWGDLNTVGIAGTDVAHLSDAGHQAIADLLLPVLTA